MSRLRALAARVRWPYAFVFLVFLSLAVGGASILYSVHYYNASQAAQRRQGQVFEQKLCATLDRLAALKPPPGSPAANPSRAYLQGEHQVLAELSPDVGCRRTP